MFNRLPPELVRQIVESSAPSTYHWSTYKKRRALLRSLCLVCKLFREIAQPLLFEIVHIDWQWKLDALLTTLKSKPRHGVVREAVLRDYYRRALEVGHLERVVRNCQGLRSLTLQLLYGGSMDLSVLQDLPHLADLHLFRSNHQFPSGFRLHALTALSIHRTAIAVAPTLLNPEILPSLRSLAMFNIYDNNEIAYLNRSRLAQLVPQLESLFLNRRIIHRGLDYLIPAYSRTLFEFDPPSSADWIDMLHVAQHLRIPQYLNLEFYISEFSASIEDQDRQISLRSIYFDISLEDLSSLSEDLVKAVQDLLRVCKEKRIEFIYEDQEGGPEGLQRPSEEFRRRQREIRKLEATSELSTSKMVVRGGG